MKLIESNIEILPQESGIEGIYKQIEKAARVCYKSEDFIKEGSAEKMVNALINRGHGSPLEHGTVYLSIPFSSKLEEYRDIIKYENNPHSKIYSKIKLRNESQLDKNSCYITTNYRVLVENN